MPKCTYNREEDIASTSVLEAHLKLLGFHVDAIHPKPPTPVNPITVKTAYPKLQLKDGFVSEEQWNFFTYSWQKYKSVANMNGREKDRLGACLGACLGDKVATKIFTKLGAEIYKELAEVEMMHKTRQLLVKTRNRLAHILKLGVMAQWVDEAESSRWSAPRARSSPTKWSWITWLWDSLTRRS